MLKKKNIAMAMAVATVATSAVPAFAAPVQRAVVDSTNEKEIQSIKDKVYKMYQKKFTEDKNLIEGADIVKTAAYSISLKTVSADTNVLVPNTDSEPKTYAKFVEALDKLVEGLKENQKVLVEYTFNGRELEDGQIVNWKETKIDAISEGELGFTEGTEIGEYKTDHLADGTPVAKIRISNDVKTDESRYVTVKVGDTKLDSSRPIYKVVNGYYVNKDGNAIQKVDTTVDVPVTLEGAIIEGYYASRETEVAPTIERDAIVKDASKVENIDMVVSDLYEVATGRATVKGNELAKAVIEKKDGNKERVIRTATDKNGVVYTYSNGEFTSEAGDNLDAAQAANVKFAFEKTEKTGAAADWKTVGTVTVKGERKAPLSHVIDMVKGEIEIYTAAGDNRYKTAVEASKYFGKSEELVLVSGEEQSLVDGLTATPLAKSLNNGAGAPILLTKQNSIPKEVIDQIKALETKTVYIVGGESVVSNSVADELKNVYGITVKRLFGDNRYETSLAVANKMAEADNVEKVFVVGGHGEADALSASGVAGKENAPIILTKEDGISKDAELFLKTKVELTADAEDIYVVGGTSVVGTKAYNQLLDIDAQVKRLFGNRREETNAAVIKEFYAKDATTGAKATVDHLVVAKSDNKGLVDALGAGALAAKFDAPIVLATDKLNEKQEDVLATLEVATDGKKVQVGYGISEAVAKLIKAITRG